MFRYLLVSVFFISISALQTDYYWRDFDGEIPSDAFPVESDVSVEKRIYIGQGLIRNHGIFIGPLFQGKKELVTAAWGVRNTTAAVKILCTRHPKNFYWHSTNSTRFFDEVDAAQKHPVVGGVDQVEPEDEVIHVGRCKVDDVWTVGIIGGQNPHHRVFSFASSRRAQNQILEFDVLIHDVTQPTAEVTTQHAAEMTTLHAAAVTKSVPTNEINDKES